ncbi:hypothetical protein Tco_1493003 [Tanacetum coccineum]
MAGEDEFHDDNPPPLPPLVTPIQQAPHTLSTIKLPILKKGKYDIWAMKMEHYLGHTDYPIWEVIQKGNGPVQVSTDTNGQIRVLPPKTTKEILVRERERKARTTLLMSIPEDHLAKFHKMTDAKEMWEAIKSRFGGVSTEDANQKFLRVFEYDVKGSTASSSSTQNVAFVSSESTSNTNDVSTIYGVSTSSGHNSQREGSSSYTDELTYSFFTNQLSSPQLDHENLEHVDEFDLEEMDLKWQVAMISMRLNKFYKKTGRKLHFDAKEPVGNQESRRRDAGNTGYKAKDNGRRPRKQEEPKALVTLDGDGVDWTGHAEDEQENFALMTYNNSGSDTEVTSCSKEYVESYAKLKKLYDEQREQLGDASIEIQAYTQALKKVEAQLVCHQQNQLIYEEKIRFMKIDLYDKTNVLTYHKKLLAEAVKEKEELKTKLENFQSSSKGLSKLLNSQMSARDKSGLGYGNEIHEGVLSYENEVLESVFNSRSSDVEDSPVNDRFANVEGMHAVPPPMTGIYMPPKSDIGIDESQFTYGPKQSKTSESAVKTSDSASCESNSSVETPESVPKPAVNEPKAVSKPKVWSDAPIIEEYESDSDDEYVIKPSKEQENPSCAFVNTDYHKRLIYMTKGLLIVDVQEHGLETRIPCLNSRLNDALSVACGGNIVIRRTRLSSQTLNGLCYLLEFKLLMKNQVYSESLDQTICTSFNLENIVPSGGFSLFDMQRPQLMKSTNGIGVQTRSKVTKSSGAYAFVSYIQKQRRNNHKDFQHCLFACFLSQNEPKKISEALEDESWVDAMQEELLQFKIQKVDSERGTIDKTLFIKKDKNDIMLVQVYMDDIIFGSYKEILGDEEFEAIDERVDFRWFYG